MPVLEDKENIETKNIQRSTAISDLAKETEMRKRLDTIVSIRNSARQRIRDIPTFYNPPSLPPFNRKQKKGKEHTRKHNTQSRGNWDERREGVLVEFVKRLFTDSWPESLYIT